MILRRRASLGLLLAQLLSAASLLAQQQPPVFRSSVEVTSVDVSVFDDRGRAIADLTPGDFSVRIEGMVRRVVSAQWVPLDHAPAATAAAAAAAPEGFSSNEGGTAGRLIVLVIDQPNIRAGGTLAIRRSVGAFIDRLQPSDRVAVIGVGPGSVATPLTGDRQRLKKAVDQMTGQFQPLGIQLHNVALSEALDILAGNPTTMTLVVQRECPNLTPPERQACEFEIDSEARQIARQATTDGRDTIRTLEDLLKALRGIDAPKTLLIVSEGFVMDTEQSAVMALGPLAAAARTSIYALKLDDQLFASMASESRMPNRQIEDRAARSAGLETLAAASRGTIINVLGNGQGAFDRVLTELSGYYLVGVESEPGDKDGKSHALRIEVNRRGTTVRSRRALFAVPPPVVPPSPRQAVIAALSTPLPVTALPLRVTTYSLQGPETEKVQLLIHADIGSDYSTSRVVNVAYIFTDLDGRMVDSQAASARVPPMMTGVPSALQFTAGASLPPGEYILKLAVAEGDRIGTVEHPVRARLGAKNQVRFSDLIVGGPVNLNIVPTQPTAGYTVVFGALQGYLEAYGGNVSGFKARYEVAPDQQAPAILTEDVEPIVAGAGGSRAIFTRVMRVRQLPPGHYVLRATLSSSDAAIETFVKPFEVAEPAVLMTSAASGSLAGVMSSEVYLPVSDTMLSRAFDRHEAIRPNVLEEFRRRVAEKSRVAFDQGVQLLRDGSYGAAESTFKGVVNPEEDSTAPLVYLAATFAASGHDLEAASAWQTSLVDGSEIPQIYEWLAGSALRTHDMAQARATLEEALAKWPADTRFARPMALVYATFGQGPEAVRSLERYLADHPDDAEMLLAGVEWIYQLHQAGGTAHSKADDVQLARKFADAYIKTKGPQQPLVRQWMDYLEKSR